MIGRPTSDQFAEYYRKYVERVPGDDLLRYFQEQKETLATLLEQLSDPKLMYRYAEGKWSVKDVAQHIIDSERIFCYRALSIARNETRDLPGFEENDYARIANADARSGKELADDFRSIRVASIALFKSFDDTTLDKKGVANNQPVSVRALGYLIGGHDLHPRAVIQERYL